MVGRKRVRAHVSASLVSVPCSCQTVWITLGQEGRTKTLLLSFIIHSSATYHLSPAEL